MLCMPVLNRGQFSPKSRVLIRWKKYFLDKSKNLTSDRGHSELEREQSRSVRNRKREYRFVAEIGVLKQNTRLFETMTLASSRWYHPEL